MELSRLVPADAHAMRELVMRDLKFRSICEDYVEATQALKHWEAQDPAKQKRTEECRRIKEFRRIIDDLRLEAIEYFRIASPN